MGYNGNGTKLIGDDGYGQKTTFGAEILGDGLTDLPIGIYGIINVAGSSGFPAAADGGADPAVGDILVVKTGDTITPATDDDVVTLTTEDLCDFTSWSLEFTKDEVEVTTLCDLQKLYRGGKPDASGSIEQIFVVGTTDDKDGFLREFIDIVNQDGDVSFDRFAKQNRVILAFLYVNNDTSLADEMWVAAPIELFGTGLGGEIGSPQGASPSFRFGNLTYTVLAGTGAGNVIAFKPTFYRLGDGT